MAVIRDLLVHVDDEVTSRHAIELAALLAGELGARLTVLLVAAPAIAGVAHVLQARSRTSDLVITSQRDPAGGGGLATAQSARLLLATACPVLIVPHIGLAAGQGGLTSPRLLQRGLVAWTDTRESARALRDAIPLLVRASHVELASFVDAGQGRYPMTVPVLMSH